MKTAIKTFQIRSYSNEHMYYVIDVYFQGNRVDRFCRPSMQETIRDFEHEGYTWA